MLVVTLHPDQKHAVNYIKKTLETEHAIVLENGYESELEELNGEIFGMKLTTYRSDDTDTMTLVIAQNVYSVDPEKEKENTIVFTEPYMGSQYTEAFATGNTFPEACSFRWNIGMRSSICGIPTAT